MHREEGPIIPAPMMTMLCLSSPNMMQRLESHFLVCGLEGDGGSNFGSNFGGEAR